MNQISSNELNSAVLDYISAHENNLIYGNDRLRKILDEGAKIEIVEEIETGGFFKKKERKITVKDRFEWGSDEGTYLANELLIKNIDTIYGVLGDGIVFMRDGFAIQGKYHNRFTLFELIDFLDLDCVEVMENNVIFEIDGYEYEDEVTAFGFCTLGSERDIEELQSHINNIKDEIRRRIEEVRVRNLEARREEIVNELADEDGNSVVLEDSKDFDILLRDSQSAIIATDRSYVQKFVKVSQFLKTKRSNINKIYELIQDAGRIEHLEEIYALLKEEKYVYDSVLFHSFHLITALVEDDMITFYEIYESFDKLSIFDSHWEKETADRLSAIESGVDDINSTLREILQQSIRMERNIVNSINQMSYMTNQSINKLNANVSARLAKVSSQLKLNNLMTGIQTYESVKRLR